MCTAAFRGRPILHDLRFFLFQSTLPVWGATVGLRVVVLDRCGFQSTLPVWGATRQGITSSCSVLFQSTLPVWGATAQRLEIIAVNYHFNPRSPCGERHFQYFVTLTLDASFQSTLPVWGATAGRAERRGAAEISIHAPRVGSDQFTFYRSYYEAIISIHAPRAGSDRIRQTGF